MKLNRKFVVNAVALAVVGLSVSAVHAATAPTRVLAFTPSAAKGVLAVKKSSWRDSAFGDMGWTHSSDWGKFSTTKGKTVTIKLVSTVKGLHPGITVWSRGKDDTAPDTFVVDHFYAQNANLYEAGAKNETNNKDLGNISMKVVAYGYDQDGQTSYGLDEDGKQILTPPAGMNGIKDKVSGQLVLTFKAPRDGNYMFVVGGFNPLASVDATKKHNVTTTVSVK